MRVHSCCDDKVTFNYGGVMRPRAANASHDLKWVRSQTGSVGRSLRVMSHIEGGRDGTPRMADGVVTITNVFYIGGVFAAKELAEYPGALRMIFNHERGHLAGWEDALEGAIQELARSLESQIRGTPTLQAVTDFMQPQIPRLQEVVVNASHDWDRQDWPQLHRALQRLGVPADLGAS